MVMLLREMPWLCKALASWAPSTNLPDGPYRWWVIGIGAGNLRSNWTAPVDFNVGGVTSVIGPAGTISTRSPVFTWKPVDGVLRYELWVTDTSRNVLAIRTNDLTSTSYTHSAALQSGTSRVWIRAVSTAGEFGPWSSGSDFVIARISDRMKLDLGIQSPIITKLGTGIGDGLDRQSMATTTNSPDRNREAVATATTQIAESNGLFGVFARNAVGMDHTRSDSTPDECYDHVMEQFLYHEFTTPN